MSALGGVRLARLDPPAGSAAPGSCCPTSFVGVSAIVEPTGVDVTIIDRTAQITTPAPTTVVLDEEPTCFRVDARRRTELTA